MKNTDKNLKELKAKVIEYCLKIMNGSDEKEKKKIINKFGKKILETEEDITFSVIDYKDSIKNN